jgi:hypothetical protein
MSNEGKPVTGALVWKAMKSNSVTTLDEVCREISRAFGSGLFPADYVCRIITAPAPAPAPAVETPADIIDLDAPAISTELATESTEGQTEVTEVAPAATPAPTPPKVKPAKVKSGPKRFKVYQHMSGISSDNDELYAALAIMK